jgi:hypothetical protein
MITVNVIIHLGHVMAIRSGIKPKSIKKYVKAKMAQFQLYAYNKHAKSFDMEGNKIINIHFFYRTQAKKVYDTITKVCKLIDNYLTVLEL